MARKQSYPLLKVMLDACIRELTPKQRDVIIRHYWDDKTVAEIAASTGVSKQAAYISRRGHHSHRRGWSLHYNLRIPVQKIVFSP